MARSQDLGVARAVFTSALLRTEAEAPEVTRDDATLFAKTLLKTSNICTSANIKLCKSFILRCVLPSTARTTALAKYLVTLSKAFCPRDDDDRPGDAAKAGDDSEGLGKTSHGKAQQPPEPAFKRLHLLYIVHDVLSYVHFHQHWMTVTVNQTSVEQLRTITSILAELSVCGCNGSTAKTLPFVQELLESWTRREIFSREQVEELQSRVTLADQSSSESLLDKLEERAANGSAEGRLSQGGDRFILPERHGVVDDPSAPWHELPAANGLYMMRTRGYPLRASAMPVGGYPVRGGGEEADAQLKKDVQDIYRNVLRCHDRYTNAEEVQDIDALGNIIWKDPERPTRNYWGFTIDGIDKRKELARGFTQSATGYDDLGPPVRMPDAVERARALAAERGRGRGFGRGRGMGRGGGWRGGMW